MFACTILELSGRPGRLTWEPPLDFTLGNLGSAMYVTAWLPGYG